jgi:ATP synthase protein I
LPSANPEIAQMIHRERMDRWAEEDAAEEQPVTRLTREQVQALRGRFGSVSPWRVVAAQAAVGVVAAGFAGLLTASWEGVWSALFGAAAVVVPGALMARGTTSRLSSMSPAVSAVSVMVWESVKVMASVAILVSAPRWVQPLHWPALLASLTVCMSVYAFALVWRGRQV